MMSTGRARSQRRSAPINEGFNRLAWLFPYLIGATGAACVGIAAFRWTRREDATPGAAPAGSDAAAAEPEVRGSEQVKAAMDRPHCSVRALRRAQLGGILRVDVDD